MSNDNHLPDGPFTIADLPRLGLTVPRLRQLLREGTVQRVFRGVYQPRAVEDCPTSRAACAALVLPAHSVVCDFAAAWIHGIDTYEPDALDIAPPLDVVAVGGANGSRRPEIAGGKRDLLAEEIVEINGLRLTSPLRTACDIACLRGRHRGLATLDAFRREYGFTELDFALFLPRYRGRRGVRQLRELVVHSDPRAESPGESWTRLEIIDAGLPTPEPQVWVDVPGWGPVRLDHAYLHLKIAIEFDGREFHGDDRREHDLARREALRRAGWIIIVVTSADFSSERVLNWTAELRTAIRDRRTPPRRRYPRGSRYTR
ncbi:MAG: hypothetical protein U0R78_12905 [Nocardioidaceae bacterium]